MLRVPAGFVPHTCHTRPLSCVTLAAFRLLFPCFRGFLPDVPDERSERSRDRLVTVSRGVLVDHRRPHAGVAEPGHQLFEARVRRRRQRPARVPEIVKMQIREPHRRTRPVPDLPEIRPAQPPALGADEDHSPWAGLGEPVKAAGPASAPASGLGEAPAGARRATPRRAGRSNRLTRRAVQVQRKVVFLDARLSNSRPPPLGRSLRSRRMRSAPPTLDPATTHKGIGAYRGGRGWTRTRSGVQLPVHPWLVATRRTPILDRLVGVMICTPAPAGRAEGSIARIARPGGCPGAIEGTTFGSSPAWLP